MILIDQIDYINTLSACSLIGDFFYETNYINLVLNQINRTLKVTLFKLQSNQCLTYLHFIFIAKNSVVT